MLQRGTYVADVAYFIGEDVPKMTGAIDPALPKDIHLIILMVRY